MAIDVSRVNKYTVFGLPNDKLVAPKVSMAIVLRPPPYVPRPFKADTTVHIIGSMTGLTGIDPNSGVGRATYLVTVPPAEVSADLTAFPLYIDLADMPSSFWDKVNKKGGNIRVYSAGDVQIPFDLAIFQKASQKGTLFVRTNISAAAGVTVKVVLETNPGKRRRLSAGHIYGRNAVWADYDMVTLFGPDTSDRTGKITQVRGNGDQRFLNPTVEHTFTEDPHQGGTWDGEFFYMVDTNAIYKYDATWTLVDTNADPIGDAGITDTNHCGDPTVKNGYLYIPLEEYPNSPYNNQHIAVYDARTLNFVKSYNISSAGHEISSICFCEKDNLWYITDYVGNRIFKYTRDFKLVGQFTVDGVITNPQGIEWYDEAFWVVGDDLDEVFRIEWGTGKTLKQEGSSTTAQGYFGETVTGSLEGIFKVGDSLYVLSDPSAANSFVTKYEVFDYPLSAGGGYNNPATGVSSSIDFDNVPSRNIFTIGVSGAVDDKAANRALVTYRGNVGNVTTNLRITLGYRQAEASFGLWDDVNTWLMPGTDHDPATGVWHRYHVVYNNTTHRKIYVDGAVIATSGAITARSAMLSVNFGRDDGDNNEVWTGKIGFGYLRNGVLSDAWLAAEYSNLNAPASFYGIVEDVPTPFEASWLAGAGDATDQSNYTFIAHALGTPAPNRKIVIGVSAWGSAAAAAPTSVTVGGVSAVLMVGHATGQSNGYTSLWIADVPSGATGDVVVSHSATQNRCGIGAWRLDAGGSPLYAHMLDSLNTSANAEFRGEGFLFSQVNTLVSLNHYARSSSHEFTGDTDSHAYDVSTSTGVVNNQTLFLEAGGGLGGQELGAVMALGTTKPFYCSNGGAMDAANLSTYTFSNMRFASPDADRKIVVGIHSDGATVLPTGVTIGGVAATQIGSTFSANTNTVSFWVADVPTGLTGNVVVSFGSGRGRCSIYVWSFYKSGALSVADSDTDSAGSNVSIDIPANGVCLAVGGELISVNRRFAAADKLVIAGENGRSVGYNGSWSGLTSRFNTNYGESTLGTNYCTSFITIACH